MSRLAKNALDVRFSGPQHPDVRKHQRTATFCVADQMRRLIARHAKIRTQADGVCCGAGFGPGA
jgi:hypothetical protein